MGSEKEEKEPIVFVVPESMRNREFKIAYDKTVEEIKSMFVIDMEALKPAESSLGLRGIEVRPELDLLEVFRSLQYYRNNHSIESNNE